MGTYFTGSIRICNFQAYVRLWALPVFQRNHVIELMLRNHSYKVAILITGERCIDNDARDFYVVFCRYLQGKQDLALLSQDTDLSPEDPDPYKNLTDPEHCSESLLKVLFSSAENKD